MSDLRTKLYSDKERSTKQRTMIKHILSRTLRQAFMKWKKKAESIFTAEDVNECGPVVEDVLEARLTIKNCTDFL